MWMATVAIQAQDLHLTQYLTSNLSLNPAYTGYYNGDYQITLNHRNQWRQLPSPMVTSKLSVEKRIQHFQHEFGLGLYVANDAVSDINLRANKFLISGSYQLNLNNHLIRFGAQSGLIYRSSDFDAQTFPEQWNYAIGEFDDNLGNNEINLAANEAYLDLNVGASWTKRVGAKWKLNAGVALFHLNRPKDGFTDVGTQRLPVRQVVNLRADYKMSNKFTITPTALIMTTTATKDLLFGAMGRYFINQDLSVGAAVSYRGSVVDSDAMIPTVMMGYKRWQLGFSNDYNLSALSEGSARKSSYEISLIYTSSSATPDRVTIPCERI